MNVLARVRHVLARRPWLYWAGVAVVAAIGGLVAADAVAAVDDARQAWGRDRTVLVAARDVAAGEGLDGALQTRALPAPMVPGDAVATVEAGAVARQRLAAGEVVVAHDVDATARPQTLIPEGWQAVAVAEAVPTGASTGDTVTVASEGLVLAPAGVVVAATATGDDPLLVAVPADEAPAVAAAAAAGTVMLLLQR